MGVPFVKLMSRVLVALASVLALSLAVPQGPVLAVGRASAAAPTPQQFFSRLKYYPHHYVPGGGPKFNNPYGSTDQRRRILHHVIETINSTPGYRLRTAAGKRITNPITHRPVVCPSD